MIKQGEIHHLQPETSKHWNNGHSVSSSLTLFEKFESESRFSVKMVTKGQERYRIENSSFVLNAGDFLVVNHGERIATSVKSKEKTEGICIFPTEELLKSVFNSYESDHNSWLEGNSNDADLLLTTRSQPLQIEEYTSRYLRSHWHLLSANANSNPEWWENFFLDLAECLVADQFVLNNRLIKVPSAKRQTKEELYRRVSKARDFIHDNKTEQLDLDLLCKLSSLSKYHFLRSFKAIFNQTPYQYLLNLKLAEAKILLANNYSYEETSQMVGFSGGRNLRKAITKVQSPVLT